MASIGDQNVCQADAVREAIDGRGAVDVWSIPLTTLAPRKPATHHPHPDHDVEGLSAMTGDKRHALTDELKLLLPVVHTCPPIGEVTGITESPYNTDRLRVVVGAAQFREAHQQGRGLGRV